MSDFICVGYKGMANAIRDDNGDTLFTAEQIRKRFSKEMMGAGVIFKMQISKGQREKCCCWFSELRRFFQLKGEVSLE